MFGASEFGPDFQRTLVRACIDDGQLRRLVQRFTGTRQLAFTDPAAHWAWQIVDATPNPTVLQLRTESRRLPAADPSQAGVQALLSTDDWRDRTYVSDQIVEWARQQVFMAGFEEARAAWNAGDHASAYETMQRRMEDMGNLRIEQADRGWFFEDFDDRQQRRQRVAEGLDYFPLGIDKIDRAMHGGLSYGELEVPLAYSGIGKTFYVTQRGFLAVRSRRKCLHFVLEGGRAKQEDRYEARFAATVYKQVRSGDFDAATLALMRREYAVYRHALVLRGFANDNQAWRVSMAEIHAELELLRKDHGWVPDMVIVDYGDLVHADGKDEREKQKNAFRQLKALADRRHGTSHPGYAVCAPSQAVRPAQGADDKEHVLRPRDVADCYEKVRTADALISINRTNYEKENDRARVHLGKYRDAEDGITVAVETDYDHGAFCKIGVEPPPLTPAP